MDNRHSRNGRVQGAAGRFAFVLDILARGPNAAAQSPLGGDARLAKSPEDFDLFGAGDSQSDLSDAGAATKIHGQFGVDLLFDFGLSVALTFNATADPNTSLTSDARCAFAANVVNTELGLRSFGADVKYLNLYEAIGAYAYFRTSSHTWELTMPENAVRTQVHPIAPGLGPMVNFGPDKGSLGDNNFPSKVVLGWHTARLLQTRHRPPATKPSLARIEAYFWPSNSCRDDVQCAPSLRVPLLFTV